MEIGKDIGNPTGDWGVSISSGVLINLIDDVRRGYERLRTTNPVDMLVTGPAFIRMQDTYTRMGVSNIDLVERMIGGNVYRNDKIQYESPTTRKNTMILVDRLVPNNTAWMDEISVEGY